MFCILYSSAGISQMIQSIQPGHPVLHAHLHTDLGTYNASTVLRTDLLTDGRTVLHTDLRTIRTKDGISSSNWKCDPHRHWNRFGWSGGLHRYRDGNDELAGPFRFPDGRGIIVPAPGRRVNLVYATGSPSFGCRIRS